MQPQLFFEGGGSGLAWRESPIPELREDTDALVRPLAVARCDFDVPYLFEKLHTALRLGLRAKMVDPKVTDHFGPTPFAPPFAVGHEFVAAVLRCGSAVQAFRPGDRVIVPFQVSCGACDPCSIGRTSRCAGVPPTSLFGVGDSRGAWGGAVCDVLRIPFADHLLVSVPEGLDPISLASAGDNLTVAWQGVVPTLRSRPGARTLVVGGGCASIALYAVGFAVAAGAECVDYIDTDYDRRAADRIATAERLGARCCCTLSEYKPDARYDLCVDASSSSGGMTAAIESAAPFGLVHCVGLHFGAGTKLPLFSMYMNGTSLRLGWGNPRKDLEHALSTLLERQFDPKAVETARVPWSEAPSAWMERGTKVIIARPELLED